jgi:hypothetical protein
VIIQVCIWQIPSVYLADTEFWGHPAKYEHTSTFGGQLKERQPYMAASCFQDLIRVSPAGMMVPM